MKNRIIPLVFKIFTALLTVLLVIFLGLSIWFYRTGESAIKNNIAKKLPLPVVLVENHPISMEDYLERLSIAHKILSSDSTVSEQQIKQQVLNQLIKEKKLQILADTKRISVPNYQVEMEFNLISQKENIQETLTQKGISEDKFKNEVLYPELLLTNTRTWFYSQKNLNVEAYTKAAAIIEELQNKLPFQEAVTKYSQDPSSIGTKGDLGFLSSEELLPELQSYFDTGKIDELQIVPSRFGIHILKINQNNTDSENLNTKKQLLQIYLPGSNFDAWLNEQFQSMTVKTLLAI